MDRNLSAPAHVKRFEDCVAERQDMWQWQRYTAGVERSVMVIADALRRHGRVYFFGNGGSAAQAQHLAAELSGRFLLDREAWAGLQNNVGNAYQARLRGDHVKNLELAISAYEAATRVFTRESFPEKWALLQNNLGVAHS